MVKLYVPLRHDEIDRLVAVAASERRRPADQAAYMLSRLLSERTAPQDVSTQVPAVTGTA